MKYGYGGNRMITTIVSVDGAHYIFLSKTSDEALWKGRNH